MSPRPKKVSAPRSSPKRTRKKSRACPKKRSKTRVKGSSRNGRPTAKQLAWRKKFVARYGRKKR